MAVTVAVAPVWCQSSDRVMLSMPLRMRMSLSGVWSRVVVSVLPKSIVIVRGYEVSEVDVTMGYWAKWRSDVSHAKYSAVRSMSCAIDSA